MRRHGPTRIVLTAAVFLCGAALAGDGSKKAVKDKFQGESLYLQHNLAHENGDAAWINLIASGEFLAVGTPVSLKKVSSDGLVVEGAGKVVAIDCEEVRPSLEVVAERILGTTPPELDALSEAEREAVGAARVETGMSRQAVFLSLGYPPYFVRSRRLDRKMVGNTDLAADELIWVKNDYNVVVVRFEDDAVVSVE